MVVKLTKSSCYLNICRGTYCKEKFSCCLHSKWHCSFYLLPDFLIFLTRVIDYPICLPPSFFLSVSRSLCQEALHREQMLEQKLATLQRLLANTQEASESSWQVRNTLIILEPCTVTQRGTNVILHPLCLTPAVTLSIFSIISTPVYMQLFVWGPQTLTDGFTLFWKYILPFHDCDFCNHTEERWYILDALYCIQHLLI